MHHCIYLFLLSALLAKNAESASSGAASSVFSNRNSKNTRYESQTNNNHFQPEEWLYERTLNLSNIEIDRPIPDEQILIAKLLLNYDPASRPVYNASHTVTINFGLALIQICDMDERNQILTTNVWLEQEWKDERLTWNKSEYNNLEKIRLPCNRLWLPDIVLYNSADDYTEGYMQSKAMVTSDGTVFWPPPAKLRSSCKIDVTYFPFDDQICHLKFGSWTYSGWQVDIMNKSTTVDMSNYIKSGEWDLKNVYVQRNVQYYSCCPDEPFPDVFFYIYIRRRILYYLFNIIFPCVWLSILSLIGFWLPPDSGEKITLGITVLLAFSVFMLLIAENIPATSEMVPLIGVYLTVIMSLTSLSIILTVVVLNLHHAGPVSPKIPKNVYFFMTRKVAKWVLMKKTVQIFESNRTNSIQESLNCDSKLFKFNLYDKKFNLIKNLSSCCRSRGFDEIYNSNGAKSAIGILANDRTDLDANGFIKTNYQDTNEKILKTRKLKTSYSSDSEDFHEVIKSRSSEFKDTSYHKSRSPHVKTTEKVNSNGLNVPITKCKCNLCQVKVRRYSNQYQKDLLNILDNFTNNLKECLVKIENNIVQINSTNEWKLIAMIIDRLLFWIFTFLTVLSTFVLLVAIPVLKNRNILSPYKYNEEVASLFENF